MKKILIVEDDRRIAQNVGRSLADENYATNVAYDGPTGLEMARTGAFDLIVLDVNLPGLNGFDLCQTLRTEKPLLPIIMLTAMGEIEDKLMGLGLGADDYVVKPFDIRELVARVHTCLRRADLVANPTPDDVLQIADLTLNRETKIVMRHSTVIDLTAKEFALLEYLLNHQEQTISKMDLTTHVWHFTFDPGTNVVEVYINYLRRKIDRDFFPKLIHTKPGFGYVLRDETK